ncbi:MAG: hypothetical protein Q9221_006698 [Calogaya cf. arnoldii]
MHVYKCGSWFYLVSVAIEARGAPLIPLMLDAIAAARRNDNRTVTACLRSFAERLDELGSILQRMYNNCDPHIFYYRIRPFLAGGKNMADAGLPNGLLFDDGTNGQDYRQLSGGSNAQSSLIQFFDIILGIEHRPTGEKPRQQSNGSESEGQTPQSRHNFIHEMRAYMPGPYRRFLDHVSNVTNIRVFVENRRKNRHLTIAYDACLAMLSALRDKHIQLVSRYIIVKHSSGGVTHNTSAASKKQQGTGGTALVHSSSRPAMRPASQQSTPGRDGSYPARSQNSRDGTVGSQEQKRSSKL